MNSLTVTNHSTFWHALHSFEVSHEFDSKEKLGINAFSLYKINEMERYVKKSSKLRQLIKCFVWKSNQMKIILYIGARITWPF